MRISAHPGPQSGNCKYSVVDIGRNPMLLQRTPVPYTRRSADGTLPLFNPRVQIHSFQKKMGRLNHAVVSSRSSHLCSTCNTTNPVDGATGVPYTRRSADGAFSAAVLCSGNTEPQTSSPAKSSPAFSENRTPILCRRKLTHFNRLRHRRTNQIQIDISGTRQNRWVAQPV